MNMRYRVVWAGILSLTPAPLLPAPHAHAQTQPAQTPQAEKAPVPHSDLDPERLEAAADAAAATFMRPGSSPGFTVAVAKDGNVVFQKSYGLADVELGVEATPDSIYRIASVTKQFTAAAVLRLAEEGKLSLDDVVTKHLPDFPMQGHTVTILHLLNHTSGIANYNRITNPPARFARPDMVRMDITYADMVELVGAIPFDFAPGERWQYNNTGYWLLGEIVSRVSGKPWDQYIEQDLLRPLGLEHTRVADYRELVPHRAEGYALESPDRLTNAMFVSNNFGLGCGALSSTAGDLVRWAYLLNNGKVLSEASYKQMIAPTVLSDGTTQQEGFGLHLRELAGHRAIAHGGNSAGFTCWMSYYPDTALSIAVLANVRPNIETEEVEAMVARAALGIDAPTDIPLTQEQLGIYAGSYLIDGPGKAAEFTVRIQDGRLRGQLPGGRGTLLRNQGDHVFIPVIDNDVRLTFEVADNRAVAVTFRAGEQERRWTRKE